VSALLAYFPASKLMHFPAALLSPTLGLANSSRAVRHQCAWNPPVEFLSYAQYEADFRAPMREAGLPLSEE
jgi:nitrate reductase gamma subunit